MSSRDGRIGRLHALVASGIARRSERLDDLCRPWHDNGLPDELQFTEIENWKFKREYMRRMASLSVASGFAFGVFRIIRCGVCQACLVAL